MDIIKDPTSWRAGFELGLAGFSFPYSKPHRKPTAYLYNGIRLPALPEWDRGVYPYVHIWQATNLDESKDYYLMLESAQAVVSADNTTYWFEDGSVFEHWKIVDEEWQKWYSSTNNEFTYKLSSRPLIWSNCDILNENNVVYLEASEPVPVYE